MDVWSDEEYFYKLDNILTTSTRFLRQTFTNKWKVETGEDWKDNQDYIQTYFVQHCENVLNKAMPLQKKLLLESCTVEDWDISLISLVLLNFGHDKKYKLENKAVRQLKHLRNELAHHKSKSLTKREYCEKVKTFKESLKILKIKTSEIDKLVNESSVNSSLGNTAQLKMLLKTAEQCRESQDFEGALKKYSEALTIPRLTSDNLQDIYEKRAVCHLNINSAHGFNKSHTDQAILDVEEALKLNKYSWNSLYLKAQTLKAKGNLSEAVRHYEMALALSPAQSEIKQELYSCRLQISTQKGNTNLNDDQLPNSANEILGNAKDEFGRPLTVQKILKLYGGHNDPVYLGQIYDLGLDVPQDYAKAVKYFKKADKQGFAEGTYNLGCCYFYGEGVPQDFSKAVEIYKRCASMDARKRCKFENVTPLGYNIGVANSEYNLAKCFELGTGVEKCIDEAIFWYKRAMEHGHGPAACNLGIYFINGHGVRQNDKMAEMCYKQGLNLGTTNAAGFLVEYYRRNVEPEMARNMVKIAREMGHAKFLEMSDEVFNRDMYMCESDRRGFEEYVTTFEKKYNVESKGMTFKQRVIRAEKYLDPKSGKMHNYNTNYNFGGKIQKIGDNVTAEIEMKHFNGSEVATGLRDTFRNHQELSILLLLQNDLSKSYHLNVVNLLYEGMLLEDQLECFRKDEPKIKDILAKMFDETCEQINELDMKIRLCYVKYNLWPSLESSDDLYALGILEEGLRRYPDNYGYIRLLIKCLKSRGSYENALRCVIKAIKKFPEKVNLYYLKAGILRQTDNVDSSQTIAAYKLFLDKAPRDHKYVPEAYYVISYVLMEDYYEHECANDPDFEYNKKLEMIKEYFTCGKEAEKDQLLCYQPYGVSDTQLYVEGFLANGGTVFNLNCNSGDAIVMSGILPSRNVLERKAYIESPVRKGLILQHREHLRDNIRLNEKKVVFDERVVQDKLQQTRAKIMGHLKPIKLQEINPNKNKILKNRILDLTVIEEPIFYVNLIQFVAEDDTGDTCRVYVDAVAANHLNVENLIPGRNIAVINPYMWICPLERINGIRINEQKCVMFLDQIEEMCRFCGEENATQKCSKCERLYCSKECQKLDLELFGHKLICSLVHEKHCGSSIKS